MLRLPVKVQIPLTGSYSSALTRYRSSVVPGRLYRRRVIVACSVETARDTPDSARGVVQFGAAHVAGINSPSNKDLTILQQRRCVLHARCVEAAGESPDAAHGVVQFGATE